MKKPVLHWVSGALSCIQSLFVTKHADAVYEHIVRVWFQDMMPNTGVMMLDVEQVLSVMLLGRASCKAFKQRFGMNVFVNT